MNDDEVLDRILQTVISELSAIGSSLVIDGTLDQDLEHTIRDIVDKTTMRLSSSEEKDSDAVSVRYAVTSEFTGIAVSNAEAQRHPAEPLMAAEVLFGVALPVLSQNLGDSVDSIRLARTLHNEIWRRFPPGAIAYVEFILSKLARAHREERLAISRELHDRVAHRLALALQRIELSQDDPDHIKFHLGMAQDEIRASLLDVQDLAMALRPMVGSRGIEEAILELIEHLPVQPPVRLTSTGAAHRLLDSVSEELFAIIIEAVRNSRRHSHAEAIDVNLLWGESDLVIEVVDNGVGFNPKLSRQSGLRTMRERAQVVGARLNIDSKAPGTSVRVEVPLGRIKIVEP